MKLLKQKDYEYMLKCKIRYEAFVQQKHWFSEWRQLDPLFEWIEGKTSVGQARDEFRELSAESLGYSLSQIKKLEDKLRITEEKLRVVTEIISKSNELKQFNNKGD